MYGNLLNSETFRLSFNIFCFSSTIRLQEQSYQKDLFLKKISEIYSQKKKERIHCTFSKEIRKSAFDSEYI